MIPSLLCWKIKLYFPSLYANFNFKVHKMHNFVTSCTLLLWNANDGCISCLKCECVGLCVCVGGKREHLRFRACLAHIVLMLTECHPQFSFIPFAFICYTYKTKFRGGHGRLFLPRDHTRAETQPFAPACIYSTFMSVEGERFSSHYSLYLPFQTLPPPLLLHRYILHTHRHTAGIAAATSAKVMTHAGCINYASALRRVRSHLTRGGDWPL